MAQKKTRSTTKKRPAASGAKRRSPKQNEMRAELIKWLVVLVLLLLTLGIYLKDSMGLLGRGVNSLFVGLFGLIAYVITIYSMVISFLDLFGKLNRQLWSKLWFGYAFMLIIGALLHLTKGKMLNTPKLMYKEATPKTGGLVGGLIGSGLSKVLGNAGAIILLIFIMILLIALLTGRSLVADMRTAGNKTKEGTQKAIRYADEKVAAAKLRQEERAAYRNNEIYLKKEQGSDQISLVDGASSSEKKTDKPEEKSKNSFMATFQTGKAPQGRRTTSIDLPRTNYDDELTRKKEEEEAARAALAAAGADVNIPERRVSAPSEQAIIQQQVRTSERKSEIIDIPLIANDAYLEKKKRYLERTNQVARQIVDEEIPSSYTEVKSASPAAAEKEPEIIQEEVLAEKTIQPEDNVWEEENIASFEEDDEQPEEAVSSFDEDGWGDLMNVADVIPEKEDDHSVSTDKMFENEEFPTGYEERNETAAKLQKEAENKPVVGPTGEYSFPPIDLLNEAKNEAAGATREELLQDARKLEEVLMNFGVEAKVVQVNRGPAVTRFELQPKVGVKVNKIVSLTDDIALNLAAQSIRIEAPIPGKSAVGIEIPNKETSMVTLREVLESEAFEKASSKVTFALGKDIDGVARVADVAKMPHMLIAGATGSGKSVCINSLIVSLLYKADPNDVKLILIDPKVVELSVYNGIPHLLLPVVNDPKQASATLNWAVQEMTRRYKLFADKNVRDIRGYNEMADESQQGSLECIMPRMPQIVIVIDELADLMMVASKEVEASICRLAQMARAAGMHLVIATQRPSVDVITGLIKANIPSRIAFAVSSGIDSRTILDSIGAEKLLGKGDMLFAPIGASKPVRIQGTFVSDKEVENVVEYVKKTCTASYDASVIDLTSKTSEEEADNGISDEIDEYLEDAIRFVVEKQKASISMLQRQFRIGFNRAARLMDALEERGVVGEDEGSKPRRVLLSREEL